MQETFEHEDYLEEWSVFINKQEYVLNDAQQKKLHDEIGKGNRGFIQFGEFSINIPMIQEFVLKRRYLKPEKSLQAHAPEPEREWTEEDIAKSKAKIAEIRRKLGAKLKL